MRRDAVLAVLALAALLGGAAAANGTAAAVASTKHATVWLGEGRWCGGRCKNCRSGDDCPSGICHHGRCLSCGWGQTACDGACRPTSYFTSRGNCGQCGNRCRSGTSCQRNYWGRCECRAIQCQQGTTLCGDQCRPASWFQSNTVHCGSCGNACPTGTTCTNGVCTPKCIAPKINCNGACINPLSDAANCGACGKACTAPSGATCLNGKCGCNPATTQLCAGACRAKPTWFATNNAHCGACGNACDTAANKQCRAGVCTLVCPSGQTPCNGACVDLQADDANCGTCGKACDTNVGSKCQAGTCTAACPTGLTACNGACVDVKDDNANCGFCGNACNSNLFQYCDSGFCACDLCNGVCVDKQWDNNNCGSCGVKCADRGPIFTCYGGQCRDDV